jgi:delta-aminolevulinic acid dehydratase/porphobilinogen synthase
MDIRNIRDAEREVLLDIDEGADMLWLSQPYLHGYNTQSG